MILLRISQPPWLTFELLLRRFSRNVASMILRMSALPVFMTAVPVLPLSDLGTDAETLVALNSIRDLFFLKGEIVYV